MQVHLKESLFRWHRYLKYIHNALLSLMVLFGKHGELAANQYRKHIKLHAKCKYVYLYM